MKVKNLQDYRRPTFFQKLNGTGEALPSTVDQLSMLLTTELPGQTTICIELATTICRSKAMCPRRIQYHIKHILFQNMLVLFQEKMAILNWEDHILKLPEDALAKRLVSNNPMIDLRVKISWLIKGRLIKPDQHSSEVMVKRPD